MLRLVATFALVAFLVYAARPTPLGVTVGFVFAAAGEAVRFWAAGHLLKTKELITSGPYRYTRNPLYLGRLLIFTGLCIMAPLPYFANWIVLLLGYAVFFGYYLPRKERVEPAESLEQPFARPRVTHEPEAAALTFDGQFGRAHPGQVLVGPPGELLDGIQRVRDRVDAVAAERQVVVAPAHPASAPSCWVVAAMVERAIVGSLVHGASCEGCWRHATTT